MAHREVALDKLNQKYSLKILDRDMMKFKSLFIVLEYIKGRHSVKFTKIFVDTIIPQKIWIDRPRE